MSPPAAFMFELDRLQTHFHSYTQYTMDYLHIAKIDTFNDRTRETVYLRSEDLSSMSYLVHVSNDEEQTPNKRKHLLTFV